MHCTLYKTNRYNLLFLETTREDTNEIAWFCNITKPGNPQACLGWVLGLTTSMYTQLPRKRCAWQIWPAEVESSRTANRECAGRILETLSILSSSSVSVLHPQSPAPGLQESHTTLFPVEPVGMMPLPALFLVVVLLWSTGWPRYHICHPRILPKNFTQKQNIIKLGKKLM